MIKNITFLIACLVVSSITAHAQLTGTVYLDANNNGKKDNFERGIQDVIVSDGQNVIKTDKNGNFQLPGWEKQRFFTLYPSATINATERFIPISKGIKSYV